MCTFLQLSSPAVTFYRPRMPRLRRTLRRLRTLLLCRMLPLCRTLRSTAECGSGHTNLPPVRDKIKPLSKTEKTAIRKQRRADFDIFTKEDSVPISAMFHRMLKHAEYPIEHPLKGVHDGYSALFGEIARVFAALFAVRLKDVEWPKSRTVRAHRLQQIEKYWTEELDNQPLRHFSHGHVHYLFKHCLTNNFFSPGLTELIKSPLVYEPYIWPEVVLVCEVVLWAYTSVLAVGVEEELGWDSPVTSMCVMSSYATMH